MKAQADRRLDYVQKKTIFLAHVDRQEYQRAPAGWIVHSTKSKDNDSSTKHRQLGAVDPLHANPLATELRSVMNSNAACFLKAVDED